MLLLTGRSEEHLRSCDDGLGSRVRIHQEVLDPFLRLRKDALEAGFDLRVLSGFRSFHDQLAIWNQKALGMRPVLDSEANPLDPTRLSRDELVFAILRWSALPGASRHHWGTDLDVFDEAARPQGYEVDLIPEEVNPGGMFGPLHDWLDERMGDNTAFGFFRPYDRDRNGVAPERWHLSHGPTALPLQEALTTEALRKAVEESEMELKAEVLEHLPEIYQRFVVNVSGTPQ